MTATSLRILSSSCSTVLSPLGSKSKCRCISNRENSIWRRVWSPLWKFFAASILSNNSRGSGSALVMCWVILVRTSHSQQKFSMNWLGSSTASHSTPLMPDTPRSSIRVSRWCSPWPNSWNKVMTSSWVNSAGRIWPLRLTGAAKLQVR